MLRRSLRLLCNGYYNSDGLPTVSYRETRVRRRRRYRRPVEMDTTEIPVEDSFDNSINKKQKEYKLLRFWWIVIVLSLFYGSTSLFSAPYSQPSESLVTLATTDTVLTTVFKAQEKLSKELHEELLSLKKKLDYLLPSADLLPNFALESQGARILNQMTSDTYQGVETCSWFGLSIRRPAVDPKIVIQAKSHLLPGQCWAFAGSQGHLSIALSHKVSISHVSMAHIPKMVSPTGSISSAPREFSVYGKKDLEDEESLLGTFLYDEDGDHLQTFKLPDHKAGSFSYIRLQVNSNWGHPQYTCLYGFRVHGKLAG